MASRSRVAVITLPGTGCESTSHCAQSATWVPRPMRSLPANTPPASSAPVRRAHSGAAPANDRTRLDASTRMPRAVRKTWPKHMLEHLCHFVSRCAHGGTVRAWCRRPTCKLIETLSRHRGTQRKYN
eukprot:scaffold234883_cov31-Tisochrysis_lutea.AAC.2